MRPEQERVLIHTTTVRAWMSAFEAEEFVTQARAGHENELGVLARHGEESREGRLLLSMLGLGAGWDKGGGSLFRDLNAEGLPDPPRWR